MSAFGYTALYRVFLQRAFCVVQSQVKHERASACFWALWLWKMETSCTLIKAIRDGKAAGLLSTGFQSGRESDLTLDSTSIGYPTTILGGMV